MELYRDVVLRLTQNRQYPILLDHVLFDIYYKRVETQDRGLTYRKDSHHPETMVHQANQPYHLVFLEDCGRYFNVHKIPYTELSFQRSPLQCLRLKIYKNGAINQALNRTCATFEEELYLLIACLNYDLPRVRSLLNLDVIQCTQMVPVSIAIHVPRYKTAPMEGCFRVPRYFGADQEPLQVRLLEGRLSQATNGARILSLRDHHAFEKDIESRALEVPPFVHHYHLYNIYFAANHGAFIPLVYNPFENPIIT